jgi:hypothetical protein
MEGMKTMKRMRWMAVLGVCGLVGLCGCGALIPSEHKEQVAVTTAGELAATHSTELTKQVEGGAAAPVDVKMKGHGNTLSLTMEAPKVSTVAREADGQDSAGHDAASGSSKKSIPMFVKLIGLVVGLGLLAGLIWGVVTYLRKNSAAGAAAFSMADTTIANWIAHKRQTAMATTDPATLASLNAEIAHFESERGKLAAKVGI